MEKATYILFGNAIFTCLDSQPVPGAVVIRDNIIVAVTDRETAETYAGEDTVRIELGDALLIPGFGDAHAHFLEGAQYTSEHFCATLDQAHSEEECVQMMVEFAKKYPGLDRYFGYGWLPSYWGDAPFPTKRSLDKYFPNTPVYLKAVDGHSEWLNSAALEEAGYNSGWQPEYGTVDTFPDGELNGLVREGGDKLCKGLDTRLPEEEVEQLQRKLIQSLNAYGITTFTEMSAQMPEEITKSYRYLKKMEKDGTLTARVFLYPGTDIRPELLRDILPYKEKYSSDVLKINGVKGFADGVTSTYTAAMLEDYTDVPGNKGYLNHSVRQYHAWVREANRLGLGTRTHCIGDFAVRTLLDACEASNKCNDNSKIRNTIEHIEMIDPADIPRFRELHVVPSMQPLHLPLDEFDKENRCGEKRSHYEWVHKSILQTGAVLALGTDYPIADYAPLPNIYNAVTRKGINGKQYGPYTEGEKLTLAEAIKGYTYGTAYALNMENKLGTIEPGKYADLAVIDKNLFQVPVEEILNSRVIMTMMNGNIVYKNNTFFSADN